MALTSQQIVSLACQAASLPGFTSQAGQWLNVILQELCQTYDLDVNRGTFNFNFNVGLTSSTIYPNMTAGGGPYTLPSDWLRAIRDEVMWFNQGVPYPMIACDIGEFDAMVQQAGNQAYPYLFATDLSQSPPLAVIWPGASGAFQAMARYYRQQPDIGSGTAPVNGNSWSPGSTPPESSSVIPWFPNSEYLLLRLTGEIMRLNADPRADSFLADTPTGAIGVLRRFLNLKDDSSNRAKRVTLDRRRFGRPWNRLPDSKKVGF